MSATLFPATAALSFYRIRDRGPSVAKTRQLGRHAVWPRSELTPVELVPTDATETRTTAGLKPDTSGNTVSVGDVRPSNDLDFGGVRL